MPKQEPEIKRPRGRPKGVTAKVLGRTQTLREMAQVYAPEAINVLARIAMDDNTPPAARVSAVNTLLDRGYGKPVQAIEHSGPDGKPIETRDMTNAPPEVLEWLAGQDTEERTVQ
jgi:hypothetical protein